MSSETTVLTDVLRTYSGNPVRAPTQYLSVEGDDMVGVEELPEDVVSKGDTSFHCCIHELVEDLGVDVFWV